MTKITRLTSSLKNGIYRVFVVDKKNKTKKIFSLKLNEDELRYLNELEAPYLNDEHVQSMSQYRQHNKTNTLDHVMRVAEAAFKMDKKLHLHSDKEVLIAAALLHDFFLYDWRDMVGSHHAKSHPERAAENASKYFDVDDKTLDAIRTHMWPINPTKIPKTREALLVTLADKYCSTVELLSVKRAKTPKSTKK